MITKFSFKQAKWVLKNVEFDANLEFVEKVAKNSSEKSYQRKSDRKMEFSIIV
jgi:hypothetical protein